MQLLWFSQLNRDAQAGTTEFKVNRWQQIAIWSDERCADYLVAAVKGMPEQTYSFSQKPARHNGSRFTNCQTNKKHKIHSDKLYLRKYMYDTL